MGYWNVKIPFVNAAVTLFPGLTTCLGSNHCQGGDGDAEMFDILPEGKHNKGKEKHDDMIMVFVWKMIYMGKLHRLVYPREQMETNLETTRICLVKKDYQAQCKPSMNGG